MGENDMCHSLYKARLCKGILMVRDEIEIEKTKYILGIE